MKKCWAPVGRAPNYSLGFADPTVFDDGTSNDMVINSAFTSKVLHLPPRSTWLENVINLCSFLK